MSRGASAEDILSLADHLPVKDYALLAPEATGHSWYPYSFLVPPAQNQPWLGSALDLLGTVVDDIISAGIAKDKIFFLGFSQKGLSDPGICDAECSAVWWGGGLYRRADRG